MRKTLIVLSLLWISITGGCGKKWEKLWGQVSKPEYIYVPLTPYMLDITNNSDDIQWADTRFRDAVYLNFWACRTFDNLCIEIPICEDQEPYRCIQAYRGGTIAGGSLVRIINAHSLIPEADVIRVEFVL